MCRDDSRTNVPHRGAQTLESTFSSMQSAYANPDFFAMAARPVITKLSVVFSGAVITWMLNTWRDIIERFATLEARTEAHKEAWMATQQDITASNASTEMAIAAQNARHKVRMAH